MQLEPGKAVRQLPVDARRAPCRLPTTRVGGLFAPDTSSIQKQGQENPPQATGAGYAEESEEPEPEPDENEMDYGDGMDAFGNPDEEE